MLGFKKLIFAPLFLLIFTFLLFQLKGNLESYNLIFSFSVDSFIKLIIFSTLICLSALLFSIFVSLSSNWKIVLPVGLVALILPPAIIDLQTGLILSIGIALSLIITYFNLQNKLKSYLTFEPAGILGPSIRHMATLLIIVFSFAYFLSINKIVQEEGFTIPDEILDTALKFTGMPQSDRVSNPKLSISQDIVKTTLKSQLENSIKPYLGIIPIILAILFFIILQSLTSFINLLIYPLLWGTFLILEKTGFIKFTEEQRTVRKMVV